MVGRVLFGEKGFVLLVIGEGWLGCVSGGSLGVGSSGDKELDLGGGYGLG